MGWLYMKSLQGHAGPRQYLDSQFTYDALELRSRVLKSALVAIRVYYAAVEHQRTDSAREVFAAVCHVRYNPRDREGYIFGYKDMTECMGPVECECPEAILNLLTPTTHVYALDWGTRCRANAEARRAQAARPRPRPGQIIVFDKALTFADGRRIARFEVVANPHSHRTMLFRDSDLGRLYRVPDLKRRAYRLVDPSA